MKKARRNNNNKPSQLHLFDLSRDLGEKNNLAQAKPEVVRELQDRMNALDAEITRNARKPWLKN